MFRDNRFVKPGTLQVGWNRRCITQMRLFKNRIAKNASWLIIGKLGQSILGFFVGIFTARFLGPSNYGLINYASSLVGFVTPVVFLGLNNTLVRELVTNPEEEGKIIGTSILLSFASSLFCIAGILTFCMIANAGEIETIIVCMLYSLVLIFQVFDLIQYWFQSKLLSKYYSIVSLIAYSIVSCYRIFLLITEKSVYWFALVSCIDVAIISVLLLVLYKRRGGQKLAFSRSKAKEMFHRSKHYIVTGMMIAIFAQTDKIMLKLMLGESATGLYATAVNVSSMVSFVYVAIIDSFRPVILGSFNKDHDSFELNLKRVYSIVIYLSLAQSAVMTLFSDIIISILYGAAYSGAASALRIVVWYIAFSYMGSIRNIWILANEKQNYLWIINLSGALLNVVMNFILIPQTGILGAATASLMTQFFSNFILGFIIAPIRDTNRIMMESLNPKYVISLFKK